MAPSGLQRFLYKRILPGDIAKLRRQSNVTASGGGARDLRFSPWKEWEPFVARMFPTIVTRSNRRIHTGRLFWTDQATGAQRDVAVEFWPPTNARPFEGRIARVYTIPPYAPGAIPSAPGVEVVFFMCQDAAGKLFGSWVTDAGLRGGQWHPDVSAPILKHLDAAASDVNVRGWVDLTTGLEKHFGA
jgi:hypothetical protein